MTKKLTLNHTREAVADILRHLNHGCVLNPPKKIGTNASCSCFPEEFARDFQAIADRMCEYPRGIKFEE